MIPDQGRGDVLVCVESVLSLEVREESSGGLDKGEREGGGGENVNCYWEWVSYVWESRAKAKGAITHGVCILVDMIVFDISSN